MASATILSDNGVTSGSAGLKETGGNDGVLLLQTTTAGGVATTAVTVDTAQNVGVGVTPSSWGSGRRSLSVAGSTANYFVGANANATVFGTNTFHDGSDNKYIATGYANLYLQSSGQHLWYNAASGTAGNAITFTQAMTLDASGNLGVGVTPSAWGTAGNIDFTGNYAAGNNGFSQNAYNGSGGWKYSTTAAASVYQQAAGIHTWYNAPSGTAGNAITFTAAMTLDASGKLTIARTGGTGISAIGVYNTTTASAANVFVVSDGTFQRSTSSARFKTNVETIQAQYAQNILNARPVWYRSLCADDNKDWGHWGFIAEELAMVDPRLVHWKTEETTFVTEEVDGQPVTKQVSTKLDVPIADGVQYDRFVPLLLKQLQEQQALITSLTERITALEAK
jgi:hypothetical protein